MKFLHKIVLIIMLLITFNTHSQLASIHSTEGWVATIQVQPIDVITNVNGVVGVPCPDFYHYGVYYKISVIFSGSTNNRCLTFNSYLYCSGGVGNEPFTNNTTYTTNTLEYKTTLLNNRQYTPTNTGVYSPNPNCYDMVLSDANCTKIKIVYWGCGVNSKDTTIDITPYYGSPLPIELGEFKVTAKSDYNLLEWTTLSEINNDYFLLERSNENLKWFKIAEIHGSGNSQNEITYQYHDIHLVDTSNYYRLTQIDYNGRYEVFEDKIIYIKNHFKILSIKNILGQNVSIDTKGLIFIQYENKVIKKINF